MENFKKELSQLTVHKKSNKHKLNLLVIKQNYSEDYTLVSLSFQGYLNSIIVIFFSLINIATVTILWV